MTTLLEWFHSCSWKEGRKTNIFCGKILDCSPATATCILNMHDGQDLVPEEQNTASGSRRFGEVEPHQTNRGETVATWGSASVYTSRLYTRIFSVTSAYHNYSVCFCVYLPRVHRNSQWPVSTIFCLLLSIPPACTQELPVSTVFCLLLCIPPACTQELPVSTVFCRVILLVCDVYTYTGLPFPSRCTLSVQTEVSECFVHGDFQSATSEEGQTTAE